MSIPDPAIGEVFGRLTVISEFQVYKGGRKALVRCECGAEKLQLKKTLTRGDAKSCGCLFKEKITTHGMVGTSVYNAWSAMLQRCQSPFNTRYSSYGGRGITVCQEWSSFEKFYFDMGDPPPDTSLERLDTDSSYCKDNCVWTDVVTQNNNTRRNVLWEYNGKKYTIKELAAIASVGAGTLSSRLNAHGWSVERAVSTPALLPSESAHKPRETGPGAVKHKLYPQS